MIIRKMINYNFTISRRYDWLKLYTSPTLMFLYGKHPHAICFSKKSLIKSLEETCKEESNNDPKIILENPEEIIQSFESEGLITFYQNGEKIMWKDIPNVDDSLHNLTKEDEEIIKKLTEALEKYNEDNSTSVLINTNI